MIDAMGGRGPALFSAIAPVAARIFEGGVKNTFSTKSVKFERSRTGAICAIIEPSLCGNGKGLGACIGREGVASRLGEAISGKNRRRRTESAGGDSAAFR